MQPAIVVVSRGDGGALSEADRATVGARAEDLRRFAVGGQVSPAQVSPDGAVALVAVPLDTAGGQEVVTDTVTQLRTALADLPDGLTVEVTGAPGLHRRPRPRSSTAPTSPCSRSPPPWSRCCC